MPIERTISDEQFEAELKALSPLYSRLPTLKRGTLDFKGVLMILGPTEFQKEGVKITYRGEMEIKISEYNFCYFIHSKTTRQFSITLEGIDNWNLITNHVTSACCINHPFIRGDLISQDKYSSIRFYYPLGQDYTLQNHKTLSSSLLL